MRRLHVVNKVLSPDERKNMVISLSETYGYPKNPYFIRSGTAIFIGTNNITEDILSKNKHTNIYHTAFTPACDKKFVDRCDIIRIKFNEDVYELLKDQTYIDLESNPLDQGSSKLLYPFYINPVVEIVSFIRNDKTIFSLSLSIRIVRKETRTDKIDYIFNITRNRYFPKPSELHIGVNKSKRINLYVTKLY